MPFIPPVSIASRSRSAPVVPGLTGKVRPAVMHVPLASSDKVPVVEGRSNSVTERLASNLKHLGKKSQPRSRLPTSVKATTGLNAKCKGHWVPSSRRPSGTIPPSCSGGSISKAPLCSLDSVKGKPQVMVKSRYREEEEKEEDGARFTLTLTPEAVLLLQRRSHERQQCLAARGPADVPTGTQTDARRRRESVPKRHQPSVARRHDDGTLSSRAAVRNSDVLLPGDVGSLVKISLLNERHKYDDVEYEEEEEDCGVDERVVLKCTEWLRGLENAPVTVGTTATGLQNVWRN